MALGSNNDSLVSSRKCRADVVSDPVDQKSVVLIKLYKMFSILVVSLSVHVKCPLT